MKIVPVPVRSSLDRWREVRHILHALERLVQANLVIDTAGSGPKHAAVHAATAYEREIEELRQGIGNEISALTCEVLRTELMVRIKREGKRA